MGGWLPPRPAALPPGKKPGTHCIGDWVGRSARVRKISPPPGFDTRTIHPVACRYIDWTIPAHISTITFFKFILNIRNSAWTFSFLIKAKCSLRLESQRKWKCALSMNLSVMQPTILVWPQALKRSSRFYTPNRIWITRLVYQKKNSVHCASTLTLHRRWDLVNRQGTIEYSHFSLVSLPNSQFLAQ